MRGTEGVNDDVDFLGVADLLTHGPTVCAARRGDRLVTQCQELLQLGC